MAPAWAGKVCFESHSSFSICNVGNFTVYVCVYVCVYIRYIIESYDVLKQECVWHLELDTRYFNSGFSIKIERICFLI